MEIKHDYYYELHKYHLDPHGYCDKKTNLYVEHVKKKGYNCIKVLKSVLF